MRDRVQTTAIPARNGVGIDFSVPSAFLAQVTPKSIPTPLHGTINGNFCINRAIHEIAKLIFINYILYTYVEATTHYIVEGIPGAHSSPDIIMTTY